MTQFPEQTNCKEKKKWQGNLQIKEIEEALTSPTCGYNLDPDSNCVKFM